MKITPIYQSFNASHKGHIGLSAAKLHHVIVCFRDYFQGPGNWSWDEVDQSSNPGFDNTMITEQPIMGAAKSSAVYPEMPQNVAQGIPVSP